MKNTITTLFSLLLMFSIVSCKKEGRDRQEVKAVVLNETVAPGATYQLDLSQYADEDDLASIFKQASHFTVSEITKEGMSGNFLYKYVPNTPTKTGVSNTDQVVLKVAEPEGRCHHDGTTITINFTIK